MIITDGSRTRVERDEHRMWFETGIVVTGCLILSVYLAWPPNRPAHYAVAGGVIAVGIVLLISVIRQRGVCIMEPTRIGYGFIAGKMWWHDRDRVGSVLVRERPLLEVRFYGRDGKMIASHVFGCFDPKELRQAFESAGIPVR
ncbi:MAG: hypothetical protein ACRDZO_25820 [Egibacteraceae bacterium]